MLQADNTRYDADRSWSSNGIIRNDGCEFHPWMCEHCAKVFSSLHDCIAHCETVAHQSNLWYPYTANGLPLPAVPQWSPMCVGGAARAQICSTDGGSPNSGGTPSRAAPSERPSPAAVLQDRQSAASAGTSSYRVRLDNVTFNDQPIHNAVLVVSIPCDGVPPPDATYIMKDAVIYGCIQAENGLTANGPPPFLPLSPVRTGDPVVGDPLSSRRPMAQSGPAPATFAASAQVQPWQPWQSGMTPMITNRPRPGMVHPERPQPRPNEGAPAGALRMRAADVRAAGVCADGWRRRRQRENNETPDSSDENGGTPDSKPRW